MGAGPKPITAIGVARFGLVKRLDCRWVNVCVFARARSTLAMLEAPDMPTPDTSAVSDSVLVWRQSIERLQAQVKFEQTRNEAGN